jgi:hypothetical protein
MAKRREERRQLFEELARLYADMERSYAETASRIGLSCSQCTDNCCVSYFQHHTYIEWAYFWEGLSACGEQRKEAIQGLAEDYLRRARERLEQGLRPNIMCPVNESGWCSLYGFRLMICRLHGVPNLIRMPNGTVRSFPGCAVCQELTRDRNDVPRLDRTPFYHRLAGLEKRFLGSRYGKMPKVNLTLAEMIVQGPPRI